MEAVGYWRLLLFMEASGILDLISPRVNRKFVPSINTFAKMGVRQDG